MNYNTICKFQRITDKIENVMLAFVVIIGGIFYIPVFISMRLYEYLLEKGKVYRINKYVAFPDEMKGLSLDEKIALIEQGKIRISTLPHNRKNYSQNKYLFPFHKERKLILEDTVIAYIENRYCDRMHLFFEKEAEWIKDFEQWHDVRIVYIDAEDIKEGMFFPQDFENYMNHGFLWHQYASSTDPEYDFWCDNHYYVDIALSSDDDIKKQMHIFMSRVYDGFL